MLGTASAALSPLLLAVLILTGCATIAHGPNQDVTFTSTPTGAAVEVDGKARGTTPTTIVLSRDKKTYDVRFTKEGYKEATGQPIAEVSGWVWGNLLIGDSLASSWIWPVAQSTNSRQSGWTSR